MKPTVLLFDIDGTLMDTGGAGRRAIERAFGHVHGRPDACASVRFGGMTDQAILRAGLDALELPVAPAAIEALVAAYLGFLEDEMARAGGCVVHPAVGDALDAAEAARAAIGLGTGNLREGARLKLGRVGLFDRFAFGGFGCDHELRAELLRIGAERGARALGARLDACRVVIIGDTPKDVAAARAIGAECVAVATGSFDVATLAACGATWAFADLAARGAIDAILAGAAAVPPLPPPPG